MPILKIYKTTPEITTIKMFYDVMSNKYPNTYLDFTIYEEGHIDIHHCNAPLPVLHFGRDESSLLDLLVVTGFTESNLHLLFALLNAGHIASAKTYSKEIRIITRGGPCINLDDYESKNI